MTAAPDFARQARELMASHLRSGSKTHSRLLRDRDWRDTTVSLPTAIAAIAEALSLGATGDAPVVRAVLDAVGRFPAAAVEIARAAASELPR